MGIKCEEVRKRHTFVGLMGRFGKACRHIVCDMQPGLTFVPRRWFADQIGAFEIHPSVDGKKSLKQMVAELPIGWSDQGTRGPMTLIGMREWQDIQAGLGAFWAFWTRRAIEAKVSFATAVPLLPCFTDVAWDCRCRWISSCLRVMPPSRLKRHVQQMPFLLTSLISSAMASPRAACFAFWIVQMIFVTTSYPSWMPMKFMDFKRKRSDAPQEEHVWILDLSSCGPYTDTVYFLHGFLANFCWKPPMIACDDTPLLARQWAQVARGLQGGMLSFDRLLQCYAPR